jgi:hypothetical protein
MSEKSDNLVLEILKKIQGQLSELTTHHGRVETRLELLEDLVRKQRRDTAGLLVMAKSVTGDFAEQVTAIEERVAALEAQSAR